MRNIGLDLLKIVAALLIVVLHVSADFIGNAMADQGQAFFVYVNSFTRIAVPLFVMCSGATLLGRDEPLGDFFTKRISRVVVPFVIWAFLYEFHPLRTAQGDFSVGRFAQSLLSGQVMFHLWFVYMIVGVYLLVPILRPMAQKMELRHHRYVQVAFFSLALLDFFKRQMGLQVSEFLSNQFLTTYVLYALVGYSLTKEKILVEHRRLVMTLAAIVLLLVLPFDGHLSLGLIRATDLGHSYHWEHGTLLVLVAACCAFVLALSLDGWFSSRSWARRAIVEMSLSTYGVYLMHMWFVSLGAKWLYGGMFFASHRILCPVTCMVCVFITCMASSVIIRRIPVIRRFV